LTFYLPVPPTFIFVQLDRRHDPADRRVLIALVAGDEPFVQIQIVTHYRDIFSASVTLSIGVVRPLPPDEAKSHC
jgi:hypothetical protein